MRSRVQINIDGEEVVFMQDVSSEKDFDDKVGSENDERKYNDEKTVLSFSSQNVIKQNFFPNAYLNETRFLL